jgi:hypothetical protein
MTRTMVHRGLLEGALFEQLVTTKGHENLQRFRVVRIKDSATGANWRLPDEVNRELNDRGRTILDLYMRSFDVQN